MDLQSHSEDKPDNKYCSVVFAFYCLLMNIRTLFSLAEINALDCINWSLRFTCEQKQKHKTRYRCSI